jgi:hypothetical protein
MPGKRGPEFGDFVTPFDEYRMGVAAADAGLGGDDSAIPILDTRGGPNANVIGQGSDENQYGRNAQIGLGILLDSGLSSVKMKVWLNVQPTRPKLTTPPVGSSSSSSSSSGPGSWWVVVVDEFSVAESSFVTIADIPPGQYKVEITEVTGTGTVSIVESHAA